MKLKTYVLREPEDQTRCMKCHKRLYVGDEVWACLESDPPLILCDACGKVLSKEIEAC